MVVHKKVARAAKKAIKKATRPARRAIRRLVRKNPFSKLRRAMRPKRKSRR